MNEQWRREMRAKMEGYGEQPPSVDWSEIERAVAERRKSERRRTVALWSRRAAAAAVAVLIVTAAVRIVLPGHEEAQGLQQVAQLKPTVGTTVTSSDGAARPDTPARPSGHAGRAAQAQSAVATPLVSAATQTSPSTTTQDSPTVLESSSSLPKEPTSPTSPTQPASPTNHSSKKKTLLPSTGDPFPSTESHRRRQQRIAVGAYLANTPSSQTSIGSPIMMLAAADPIGNYYKDMGSDAVNGTLDQPDKETTVAHSRPVRVGLSLRYGLSPRWSLETGLVYTYLHSEITHRTGRATHTDDQRLHYVGIPVGLNYNIWSTSRIGIYASASVMAEKCVGGTETISRPQFSAGAAFGAELNLGGGIGLYVEPGVTHRFDNHSTVPTIYKDRPTDFNLDIGLRLNLR